MCGGDAVSWRTSGHRPVQPKYGESPLNWAQESIQTQLCAHSGPCLTEGEWWTVRSNVQCYYQKQAILDFVAGSDPVPFSLNRFWTYFLPRE